MIRSRAAARSRTRSWFAAKGRCDRRRGDSDLRVARTFCIDPLWSLVRRTTLASITMLGGHPEARQSPTMGGWVRQCSVQCRKARRSDFEFAAFFHLTNEQAPESLCT